MDVIHPSSYLHALTAVQTLPAMHSCNCRQLLRVSPSLWVKVLYVFPVK